MFHPFKNICDYPRNVDCEAIKGNFFLYFLFLSFLLSVSFFLSFLSFDIF